MIYAVEASGMGESVYIELAHPERSGFNITNIEGIGPGNVIVNTTPYVNRAGSMFNNTRKPQRNIVITMKYMNFDTIEQARRKSYRLFSIGNHISLSFYTETRIYKISGMVESNEPVIFAEETSTQISIICTQPWFYSEGEFSWQETAFNGIIDKFEFPFSNEGTTKRLEMGEISKTGVQNILYKGDVSTGVYIDVYFKGQVNKPMIITVGGEYSINYFLGDLSLIGGVVVGAGDRLRISSMNGAKSITYYRKNDRPVSALNILRRDFTSWLELHPGDNEIAIDIEGQMDLVDIKISNPVYYQGV